MVRNIEPIDVKRPNISLDRGHGSSHWTIKLTSMGGNETIDFELLDNLIVKALQMVLGDRPAPIPPGVGEKS